MREALDRLLSDLTLVTIALAIGLGWSLFQFASGVSELVVTLFIEDPSSAEFASAAPLTWSIGDRPLTLAPLVRGSIELVIVLAVAVFVRNRYSRRDAADIANPS